MQKKIIQQQIPQVRKVYTTTTTQHHPQQQQIVQQSTMQLNAVKKINSLLQSGSVSVTGLSSPGQQQHQRIVQKKPIPTLTTANAVGALGSSTPTNNYTTTTTSRSAQKCCICGDHAGLNATAILEASTTTTQTEFVTKLAKAIGSTYSMVLSTEDVICRRCITILNQLDKLESEMETLRGTLISYIHKNNNIPDEVEVPPMVGLGSPPAKMPKLAHFTTTGGAKQQQQTYSVTYQVQGDANTSGGSDLNTSNTSDMVEAQLTSMFEKSSSPGTAVKQQQQQQIVMTTNNGGVVTQLPSAQRKVAKLYKCMPCGFKTTDLALFQPHYENCPPRNAATAAAAAAAIAQNANAATATATNTAATTAGIITSGYRCKLCKLLFASLTLLRQHSAQEHGQKTIVTTSGGVQQQVDHQVVSASGAGTAGATTTTTTTTVLYSCNVCPYKTTDKQAHDDHLRKHIKLKPFKCRVCLMRFETREQASIHAKQHQPDYFKCGICNVTFSKRELLMSHLEVHESAKKGTKQQTTAPVAVVQQQQHHHQQQQHHQEQQQQQVVQQQQQQHQQQVTATTGGDSSSTQKLLQETIDEALRESIGDTIDAKLIQFHTCNACSLTFLNEKLYLQHIKTHATATPSAGAIEQQAGAVMKLGGGRQQQLQQQQQLTLSNSGTTGVGGRRTESKVSTAGNATISDGDLESIFERMHSDPKGADGAAATTTTDNGGSMAITNQDGTTFNITLQTTQQQQDDGTFGQQQQEEHQQQQSVGIDMPTLDQGDEQQSQKDQQQLQSMPVSMPSLDDDGEQSQNSQNSNTENVPMELDDMQQQGGEGDGSGAAGAGGGTGQQINLILNDGQVLQLDNHILTTDAEGNQILVQGADTEHIQQLLQSVGVVMQGGEGLGEGETLQMISGDGNNQMILVQGADGQEQLIDASLLNADGNIVIQQSQEGELNAEGTHITTEDGLQIPVSVAFTTAGGGEVAGGHEGQLTVAVADGSEQQLQLHLQQAAAAAGEQVEVAGGEQHQGAILTESGQIILQQTKADDELHHQQQQGMVEDEEGLKMVVDGADENGTVASESVVSDAVVAADGGGQTNGGDGTTAASSNGTTVTVATTSGTTTNVTSGGAVTAAGSGDDQMFNFDELIQPQIVIKQQQVK